MREAAKTVVRWLALAAVLPALLSFWIKALVLGRNRALEGSTQTLSLVPGILGQYLRRAFLSRVLAGCDETAAVCFGTIFSQTAARIEAHVYIGARCFIGLAHVERGALIGSGVHITSGPHTHGTTDPTRPIREQEGDRRLVTVGRDAWIGSASVIMADVGAHSIVGAGSVVTRPIPDNVVAAGVPARVIRSRDDELPRRSVV